MLLKIFKNRTVSSSGTWGTKNENNYEILNFEFPEELEEYNKRIVYYLGNQKVWDPIIDNKAILTNAITTKGSVKAYIWCTKSDEAFETDVDFRTQIFVMNFFENDNADGIVPTPEQVDGFNTMLTAMNEKIEEIDALETTIENAETQRQENEETRQENESTRQTNEQTRQSQEAERERRTDEAIADIQDKTAEYNANAEEKTTAFNNNASQKTNQFNSNYTQKVNDFNTNASSKELAFNSNAESKTSTFNTNATNKTNDFNSNATSKTTDFNTNAENKTTAFNSNATDKTTNFDNNASDKTTTFNENATSKTNTFNDNATQKTTDFNNNAQAKTDAFDEHTEEMQQEIDELSANMPWAETEQATEISVDDAAKYSRNKLELFGNTSQDSTSISGGDEYDSPSPDHPQPIHVVTGNNSVGVQGKNLIPGEVFEFCTITNTGEKTQDSTRICTDFIELDPAKQYFLSASINYGFSGIAFYDNTYTYISRLYWSNSKRHTIATTDIPNNTKYVKVFGQMSNAVIASTSEFEKNEWYLEEGDSNNTKYVPYYHADYPINLGSLEFCQIGSLEDYPYKENDNWYKYGVINKVVLDGTKNWIKSGEDTNVLIAKISLAHKQDINFNTHFPVNISGYFEKIDTSKAPDIYLGINKSRLQSSDVNGLKTWLDNNNVTLYYILATPTITQITDETLIAQLDAIYEHLQLVKGTNNITITSSDLPPKMKLTYMQDLPSKLDNLDSRLSLLE